MARVDGKIGDSGAKKYWYVTDHVGSIRAITDKDGKKVWSADYLAFGKQYIKDGDFEELHSFTGKEYDPDTGLHYYNARWYDSDLGRFISEDPVADPNNPNLYSYGANNPLRFTDPTGLFWDGYETDWDTEEGYDGYLATPEDMAGAGTYDNSSSLDVVGDPIITTEGDTITTKTTFADGSYSITETIKHGANPDSGVSQETITTCTFDRDGNLLSSINVTTYSKNGSGSVEIHTVITGNVATTWYDVKDTEGNGVISGYVEDISVIGLRGWGEGKATLQGKNEHSYDDMLIVIRNNGFFDTFNNVNFEGSKFSGKVTIDGDPTLLFGDYPSIRDGVFTLNAGKHNGVYNNLRLNNGKLIGTQRPNYYQPGRISFADGIEIHKGGLDWTWSKGCITVYEDDWDRFISNFQMTDSDIQNHTQLGTLYLVTLK